MISAATLIGPEPVDGQHVEAVVSTVPPISQLEGSARNKRGAQPLSQFSQSGEPLAVDVIARLDLECDHGAAVSLDGQVHFVVIACAPTPESMRCTVGLLTLRDPNVRPHAGNMPTTC